MKNKEKEEVPTDYINRNPMILGIWGISTLILIYFDYQLLKNMNPWGFLVMIPAAFLLFQSLWLLLNPFALIYSDKFEVKPNLFNAKACYFIDIRKVGLNKKGHFVVVYKDDDSVVFNLTGMQKNKVGDFKKHIESSIQLPLD